MDERPGPSAASQHRVRKAAPGANIYTDSPTDKPSYKNCDASALACCHPQLRGDATNMSRNSAPKCAASRPFQWGGDAKIGGRDAGGRRREQRRGGREAGLGHTSRGARPTRPRPPLRENGDSVLELLWQTGYSGGLAAFVPLLREDSAWPRCAPPSGGCPPHASAMSLLPSPNVR